MIKLLLPNNNLINIQLSGEETELKELISTITDLSPSQIKGIKDSQGNYYTFSSAMKSLNVINNKQQNYFELIWSKSSKHNTLSPIIPKYTYDHRQNIILNSSPKVGHYYANYYFNKKYQSNANTNTNNALLNNNNNINYNNFNKNEMYHSYLRHFHENKLINDSQYLDIMKLINANNKELLRRFDLFICGKLTLNSFISCITCIDLLHEDKRNDVVNEVDALCDICVYFGEDDMKILRQMIQYENENALKAVNAYLKDKDITLFVEALNKVLTVFKNKSQCFKMKPKSSLNVGSNSNNNVDNVDEFNLNENKNYKMYSEKGNTNKKNVFAIKKSSTNDLRKSSVQYESTHKGIKKKLPSSQNVGNNEDDNNNNNKHRESKYKRNENNDDDEEDDDKDSYLYTQQSNKVRESVDFGNNSNSNNNNNGNNNFNINPNKKITHKQSNKMVNDTTHKSNSNNNSSSKTKSLKTLKKRNKTQQDFRATEGNNNSVNHNNINNNPNNMKDYFTITNNTFNNGNTIVTTNSQDKPKAKASKHNLRLKSGKLINTAAISSSITNTNNNVLTSSITNTSPNKDNAKPKNNSTPLNTSPSKNNNTSIPLVNKDNVIDYIKTKFNKVNYIYFNYLIKNKADIKNELISLINSNNKNDNLNNNFTSKAVNICIESHLKNDLINQSEKTKYLLNASDFELLFQLTRKDDNQILNIFKTFETNNNKELLQKEIFNVIQEQKNQSDASSNSDNNNNNSSNNNNNNQSKQLNNNKQSSTFSFEETSRMFLKDIKELNLSNKEIEKLNLLIKMNNSKLISLIKEYSINPNIKLYKDQIISLTATSAVNQGSVILKKLESRGNNNSNEYAKKVFRFSDKKINNNILNNNKHENKNESRHQSKGEVNLLQPPQQQQQQQQQQFASVQQLFAYFAHERTFTNQQLSILSTLLKTCSNNVGTTVGAYGMELEVSLRNFLSLEHEAQKTKLKDLIKKLISILTACTKRIKEDSATDSSNSTANTPLRDLTKTPDTIKRTKTELNCFLRSKEEQQQSKKEKNIIEKQKEIITLLYKEKCISKKTYKLILQKIEENEQSLIAAFEVYAVTKNHYEFIETLNIIAELSENYKGMFCTLLNQSTFTMKEQEKLISLYNQKDENLFSFLELYDKTKDKEDFYESLTIQLKKIEED